MSFSETTLTTRRALASSNKTRAHVDSGGCYLDEYLMECALLPDECTSVHPVENYAGETLEWIFRSSHTMAETGELSLCPPKAVPDIAIGVCASEQNGNDAMAVCTGDAFNCQNPALFQSDSDQCTVARTYHGSDGGSDGGSDPQGEGNEHSPTFTLYGKCTNLQDGSHTCVWSPEDCPSSSGYEFTRPIAATTASSSTVDNNDLCTCDKTLVGACHHEDEERYYCAVSPGACGGDPQSIFFNAWALQQIPTAPECYLCRESALEAPTTSKSYVEPGGCYLDESNFVRCALNPEECQDQWDIEDHFTGEVLKWEFRSSREMEETKERHCQEGDEIEKVNVGVCVGQQDGGGGTTSNNDGDRGSTCTSHASNCADGTFVPRSNFCKVLSKSGTDSDGWSLYGKCSGRSYGSQSYCVWSSDECPPSTHEFVPASQQTDDTVEEQCTCDKTIVGACAIEQGGDMLYSCAVSEDACDDNAEYIAAFELRQRYDAPTCYLCREFEKSLPPPPPPAISRSPTAPGDGDANNSSTIIDPSERLTIPPHFAPPILATPPSSSPPSAVSVSSSSRQERPILIGGLIIAVAVVVLVVVLVWRWKRRQTTGKDETYEDVRVGNFDEGDTPPSKSRANDIGDYDDDAELL